MTTARVLTRKAAPHIVRVQFAAVRGGNDRKFNPVGREKAQGPHDRIVFQARRDDMISRFEQTDQGDIEGLGGIFREDDPQGVIDIEKTGQGFPGFMNDAAGIDGKPVTGASG